MFKIQPIQDFKPISLSPLFDEEMEFGQKNERFYMFNSKRMLNSNHFLKSVIFIKKLTVLLFLVIFYKK